VSGASGVISVVAGSVAPGVVGASITLDDRLKTTDATTTTTAAKTRSKSQVLTCEYRRTIGPGLSGGLRSGGTGGRSVILCPFGCKVDPPFKPAWGSIVPRLTGQSIGAPPVTAIVAPET
jgi:hypothetical protein